MAPAAAWPVALFVPNLIGYVRVLFALAAFPLAFSPARWHLFFWLYGASYALDAVDGVAARALGQTSRFGAVLDMVTDRFCTAGLLAVLAQQFPAYSWAFHYLLILDVASHWVQMYRCVVVGGARSGAAQRWGARVGVYVCGVRVCSGGGGGMCARGRIGAGVATIRDGAPPSRDGRAEGGGAGGAVRRRLTTMSGWG